MQKTEDTQTPWPVRHIDGSTVEEREHASDMANVGSLVVDRSEIVDETLEYGTTVTVNKRTGRYVAHTYRGELGVKIVAVTLSDDGNKILSRWRNLRSAELDNIDESEERGRHGREQIAAGDKAFAAVLASAKTVPLIYGPFRETKAYSLDDLERLTVLTGATLTLVRGSSILVEAPDPAAVAASSPKLTVDDRVGPTLAGRQAMVLAMRHDTNCEEIVKAVDYLGDLAVAYVKGGSKRPKADVGRGKANRVAAGGAWTT